MEINNNTSYTVECKRTVYGCTHIEHDTIKYLSTVFNNNKYKIICAGSNVFYIDKNVGIWASTCADPEGGGGRGSELPIPLKNRKNRVS